MKPPWRVNDNKGFAVLIGVLIVGAFGLAVALYLLTASLNSYQSSYILEQSNMAKAGANACAEVAMNKIQLCSSTTGIGNAQMNDQACNYEIITTGDHERLIQSSATFGSAVRKVKILVNQIEPVISVESWQEVVSF